MDVTKMSAKEKLLYLSRQIQLKHFIETKVINDDYNSLLTTILIVNDNSNFCSGEHGEKQRGLRPSQKNFNHEITRRNTKKKKWRSF